MAETARRRKVGRGLIERVKHWAREQGCYTKLLLIVGDFNVPAVRLYESCGFKPSGDLFDSEDRLPEHEYCCPLSEASDTL